MGLSLRASRLLHNAAKTILFACLSSKASYAVVAV